MRSASILACALAFAAGSAAAQSAVNGELLYTTPAVAGKLGCGANACHGNLTTNPQNRIASGAQAANIKSAMARVSQMRFLEGQLGDAQLNDIAAYVAGKLGSTAGYLQVVATPVAALAPASVNFGPVDLLTAAPVQTVTVTNTTSASAALVLGAIGVSTGSDFSVTGGTCRATLSLPVGASCTVLLGFTPTANGTRSAQLSVVHNAAGGGSSLALTGVGTGTSPVITVAPTALSFSQTLGSSSDALRVLVGNIGNGALRLAALRLEGTHASDFAIVDPAGCAVGASLAGGQSCALDLRFTPAALGARSANLVIEHNAMGGSTSLALAGSANATPRPGLMLDANRLDLGNQTVAAAGTPQTLTLLNNGQAPLNLSRLALSGARAAEFALGGSCAVGTPIAPRASCTVRVTLTPAVLGAVAATLQIGSDAPAASVEVALVGSGVPMAAPAVSLSQAALGFGTVAIGGSSAARTAVLTNSGNAALQLTGLRSSSAEFALTHDCPANPATLPAGASCSLRVVYAPAGPNASEAIVIDSNAPSSPNTIVLTGLGSANALPVLDWVEGSAPLGFGDAQVGGTAAPLTRTLVNRGPGRATLTALRVAGADAGSFVLGGGTCSVGTSLAAAASCTVLLRFAPSAAGARAAVLQVASDASNPAELVLGGNGAGYAAAQAAVAVAPAALDWSTTVVATGARSEPLVLRIVNAGMADTTLAAVTTSAGFTLVPAGTADACPGVPWTLAPGAACSVAVVFAPATGGAAQGTLKVTTSAGLSSDVTLAAQAQTTMTNQGSAEQGGGALGPAALLALLLASVLAAWRRDDLASASKDLR